jgi:hypothetical protein
MATTTQQQQLEALLKDQIYSNKKLADEKVNYEWKSNSSITLNVVNREGFKSELENTLKQKNISATSKKLSGSSFEGTVITFKGFKSLNVLYKNNAGDKKATTAQQELGATYIFTQALIKNVKYTSPEDLLAKEEKKLKEIFKVPADKGFPYIEWIISFYYSQKILLQKYGSPRFTQFDRDGGFMEYITNLVKIKFGISKKDTWDPADVWAIDGSEKSIENIINSGLENFKDYRELKKDYSNNPNLLEDKVRLGIIKLNEILIGLLKDEKVIGISLKKTNKNAKFEEVNTVVVEELIEKNKALINTVSSPFMVVPSKDFTCKFDIPVGQLTFTQDVKIDISDESGTTYNFQIKAGSSESTTGSNLKFELTIKGKSAARGGKVPVDMLDKFINKLTLTNTDVGTFINQHAEYPKNAKEWSDHIDDYKKMFVKLKQKNISFGFGVDVDTFVSNVTTSFNNGRLSGKAAIATNTTCKLMAFHFIYMILCQMKEERMSELLTDMAFLAQKKNTLKLDTFGPFVKIA